jgi:hypothetical protein
MQELTILKVRDTTRHFKIILKQEIVSGRAQNVNECVTEN